MSLVCFVTQVLSTLNHATPCISLAAPRLQQAQYPQYSGKQACAMPKVSFSSSTRLSAALLTFCIVGAALARAQNSLTIPSTASESAPQTPPNTSLNDQLLAKASGIYFSAIRTGLNGFTCDVHPNWRTLLLTSSKGASAATDDPRITLAQTVKITLHARLAGGSTIDWNPTSDPAHPLDADSTSILDSLHTGTNQSLLGFMQFWTPSSTDL